MKLAQVIANHLNGEQTDKSRKLLAQLSGRLQSKGFTPPFKISSIKTASVTFIKTASVTFSLPSEFEKGREAQPMDLGSISHDLMNYIVYKRKGWFMPSGVEVDGDSDYFGYEGVINFYFPKNEDWENYTPLSDEELQRLSDEKDELYDRMERERESNPEYADNIQESIDQMNDVIWKADRYKHVQKADTPEEVAEHIRAYESEKPFKFGPLRMETSGMTGGPVMRIPVIKNDTQNLTAYPELNISSSNFEQLADLLITMGVDGVDEHGGRISIEQLKAAIASIKNDPDFVDLYTRESYDSGSEEGKGQFIDFGLRLNQMMRYFNELQKMINFAEEHQTGDEFITAG